MMQNGTTWIGAAVLATLWTGYGTLHAEEVPIAEPSPAEAPEAVTLEERAPEAGAETSERDTGESAPQMHALPTTRPAADTPIIRIGDAAVITQGDFDVELQTAENPGPMAVALARRLLVGRKMIEIYLNEHPDFIKDSEVDEAVKEYMKLAKIKTEEEFIKALAEKGYSLEYFRNRKREELANKKFNIIGTRWSEEESRLKELWKEDPTGWNGTRVAARHILIAASELGTKKRREEARKEAEQIREDLKSGKLSWEEAVEKSDCRTRGRNGKLGSFRRHLDLEFGDEVAKFAFEQKVGALSPVVESPMGYHILQVTGRHEGQGSFEDAKRFMRIWLRLQPKAEALQELRAKHDIVTLRAPALPEPRQEPVEVNKVEDKAEGSATSPTRPRTRGQTRAPSRSAQPAATTP